MCSLDMELSDNLLCINCNWDPSYLASVCNVDFIDFSDLWVNEISDKELLEADTNYQKYCPVVEDISIEDSELCLAVEQIEKE